MNSAKARVLLDAAVTEAELQANVLELAGRFRWLSYHTHDSRRSPAGFPDLVLVRGERLVFAELKREGRYPTPAQRAWLSALGQVTTVDAHSWRPRDWSSIEEVLR
jgi:hypothetical protein